VSGPCQGRFGGFSPLILGRKADFVPSAGRFVLHPESRLQRSILRDLKRETVLREGDLQPDILPLDIDILTIRDIEAALGQV
jgi:hypothetical protein